MSDDQKMPSFLEAMPFAATLGIELHAASAEEVRGTLQWTEDRCTVGGVLLVSST